MASAAQIEVRPRTTGEILDDAWQLYFKNAPLLLAISSLFTVPWFIALICLLTQPVTMPAWQKWLAPAIAAFLLPWSGLGSGACQVAFRRGAERQPPILSRCLLGALGQSWNHAAARGIIVACFFLGSWLLLLPGLAALMSGATIQPILAAGERSLWGALRTAGHEAQRQPIKTGAIVLCRFPILLLAVINLYMLVRVGIWTAEHLAGFDLALLGVLLSIDNPVFLTALVMLAWLLLAPYFEAANYLLHVDGRARYEGLDLWYRVQRFFPLAERSRAGVFLLALAITLLAPFHVSADNGRLAEIKTARKEIQAISFEIIKANPYPGSEGWAGRLKSIGDRLDRDAPSKKSRYRWFHQAIEGFGHRGRESALQVLSGLEGRLALIEDSLHQPARGGQGSQESLSNEELRKLLPAEDSADGAKEPEAKETSRPKRQKKVERPVPREEPEIEGPVRAGPRGPGVFAPHPEGGFNLLGWLIVVGILVAVVVLGLILLTDRRKRPRPHPSEQQTGPIVPSLETILTRPDEYSVTRLWREADDLARAGRAREAVRTLYLAVLALLHRSSLIRFERTRTNGEYVRQLRSKEVLRAPFAGMTNLFEVRWYSESACEPDDYTTCRSLAESIRENVN